MGVAVLIIYLYNVSYNIMFINVTHSFEEVKIRKLSTTTDSSKSNGIQTLYSLIMIVVCPPLFLCSWIFPLITLSYQHTDAGSVEY